MIRTFLDSDLLIGAARGVAPKADQVLRILTEPDREFVSSVFIRLEVLPKAKYFGRTEELNFYLGFFDSVVEWFRPDEYSVTSALAVAETFGLGPIDALHLTAARILGTEEFITGEKPSSPLFRVRGIKIVSLFA
jgi:predicted nucleic acid-binding protein